MLLRLLLVRRRALRAVRRGRTLGLWDVARTPFRVGLTDLDVLRHMNNGRYLSILDLGRMDLMYRSSMWPRLRANGIYPVVAAQTITYRRSLEYGNRFVVETRVDGVDDKNVYLEQRFTVRGEVHALAHVRGRFLRDSGGTVTVAELTAALEAEAPENRVPAWVQQWAEASTLAPARASQLSVWDGE